MKETGEITDISVTREVKTNVLLQKSKDAAPTDTVCVYVYALHK